MYIHRRHEYQIKYKYYICCSPTNLPPEGLIIGPGCFQYLTRFRALQKYIYIYFVKTMRSLSFSICYNTVKTNYSNYTHFSHLGRRAAKIKCKGRACAECVPSVQNVGPILHHAQLYKDGTGYRILRDHLGPSRYSLHAAGYQQPRTAMKVIWA